MKKQLFLPAFFIFHFSFLILTPLAQAQAPNYLWAKSAGGTADDKGNSCVTDFNGNVFVTGSFESSSITFGTTTITNAGNGDMFLVKYDPNGNVLWAKSAGGSNNDYSNSCTTDLNGNIFVTGGFRSPSITFGTTTLTNNGNADIFIVKYDSSGNVLWATSAGGIWSDEGDSCATDANGNVFVTGKFGSPSITFGTTTLTNTSLSYYDMFIVKYDSNGNVLWAKSAGGNNDDEGNSCVTDFNGNVFVTGYFLSSSITFGTTTLTNAGTWDIFLVKYDPNGNVLWAKSAGGSNNDYSNSCVTDFNGNVFVTGQFGSSSITFGTTTLTNSGLTDVFLVKYDPNGNVLWATSAGGGNSDWGASCDTDANGNVFVTGLFSSSSIIFGTTTLTNLSPAGGPSDIFLVKYDSSGNLLWATSAGGTSSDRGISCATDANGNVFVTGYFWSSSITFGTTTLTNTGNADIFLVKLNDGTPIGIEENNFENEVSIFPNPTSGTFQVKSQKSKVKSVEIYNVLGERIYSSSAISHSSLVTTPVTNAPVTIDLSSHPSGIYFLHLKTEQGTAAKKLIINK